MLSAPNTISAHTSGGIVKYPLVVMWKFVRKYSATLRRRCGAARLSIASDRARQYGMSSPMWPMMTCSFGKRSKTPATTSRRLCRPISACQPQPADGEGKGDGLREAAVIRLPDTARGRSGMEIERNAEPLGRREHRLETPVVEEQTVDCSVDHGPDEPELRHAPLELGCGPSGSA